MKNSKILEITRSLSKKERLSFQKYLKSVYFNKRTDLIQLWDYLVKATSKGGYSLKKETVSKVVYPGQAYSDRDFHLLKSYLIKHLEKFLSLQEFEKDPILQESYLLRKYKQKNLKPRQLASLKKLKNANEVAPFRDTQYLERSREILWEEYQMEVANRPSDNLNLAKLMDLTDLAYYSRKLRQICLMVAHQSVYSVEDAANLERHLHFLPLLQEKSLLDIPAIGLYYYGYQLFRDRENIGYFNQFKETLLRESASFENHEIRELFLIAINYCVRQVNDGNKAFFQELLELYQGGLAQQILLENGRLSRFTFHNVVATGLQVKEYEWIKSFIVEYQSFLESAYRESSVQYNLARLEFETEDFDSAQARLIQANFSDILLNLSAKTISLKIFYQQAEYDLLQAHINAMKKFIRRNKVIGYHRQNYQNILRYAGKLINTNQFDRVERKQLAEDIEKEEILTEKVWLLKQVALRGA